LAQRVAELFGEQGLGVPDEIRAVIAHVAELARSEVRLAVGGPPAADDG
jgi:hypothetical protein